MISREMIAKSLYPYQIFCSLGWDAELRPMGPGALVTHAGAGREVVGWLYSQAQGTQLQAHERSARGHQLWHQK